VNRGEGVNEKKNTEIWTSSDFANWVDDKVQKRWGSSKTSKEPETKKVKREGSKEGGQPPVNGFKLAGRTKRILSKKKK